MTHSNIDLIRSIKYNYTNIDNSMSFGSFSNSTQSFTMSFRNSMKQLSHTTQSMSEKINVFKQTIGYTSSHSFTHSNKSSFTHSLSSLTQSSMKSKYNFRGTASRNSFIGPTLSGTQSYSFNNSIGTYSHKFFTKVDHSIKKLDNAPLSNIVSTINKISLDDAKQLITTKKVSINGVVVTDINHQLSSLDIVRIGFEGHFINNPNGIAIIK